MAVSLNVITPQGLEPLQFPTKFRSPSDSIPAAWKLLPGLVWLIALFLWSPYKVWNNERLEKERLEARLRPSLSLVFNETDECITPTEDTERERAPTGRVRVVGRHLGLIRFGGYLPKGEYDVDHDGDEGQAVAAELHG